VILPTFYRYLSSLTWPDLALCVCCNLSLHTLPSVFRQLQTDTDRYLKPQRRAGRRDGYRVCNEAALEGAIQGTCPSTCIPLPPLSACKLSCYKTLTFPASWQPPARNFSFLGRRLSGMVPRHQSARCKPIIHESDLPVEVQIQPLISHWYACISRCLVPSFEANVHCRTSRGYLCGCSGSTYSNAPAHLFQRYHLP
jgi:hypothetical protein